MVSYNLNDSLLLASCMTDQRIVNPRVERLDVFSNLSLGCDAAGVGVTADARRFRVARAGLAG